MNGNNFNTENFFGLENLEKLLSTVDAKKLGRDFGKKFSDGLSQALQSSEAVKKGLSGYEKSLQNLKKEMSNTIKGLQVDDKTRKSFESAISSSIAKAEKQADSLKSRLSDVYSQIEKESKKPVKDVEKMFDLYRQITGLQSEYNILQATTTEQIRLQADDMSTKLSYEKLLNEQQELNLKKGSAKSKKDKEEIKDLERKLELHKEELSLTEKKNDARRKNVSDTKANYKEISDMDNQMLDDFKKGMNEADKGTKSFFGTWKNGLSSIESYLTNVFDLWNNLFNDTENRIERYSQEFGERWKIRNDISKNIGGANFDEYQKGIYDSTTSGSMRGMFNEKELKEHLVTMSEYLFESKEAAIENSQLIAYGNKFLGMSTQSMQSIYNLEKMTNGDGFIRSQLQTITKLQNSGLITSEAQLDKLTLMSSTIARDLSGLNLSGDAAKSLQTSMTEMSAVLDNKLYEGAGQEYSNAILDALKSPEKGIELFGDRYSQALGIVRTGDQDAAWQLLDLIQNNALSKNIQGISADGFGINTVVAGQQFGNTGLFNNLNNNWDQVQGDRSKLASMGYDDYLDKSMNKDSDVIDDETKRLNQKSVEIANGNYTELIKQAESTQRIETHVKNIKHWVSIIGGALSALTIFETAGKLFGKGGSGGGSGLGSKLLGKLKGAGTAELGLGNGSGIWASAGSGGSGLFGAGMGTTLLGGGLVLAGTGWAAVDGITGGMSGLTDKDGNLVMGPGLGTGLTAAVGGKGINTESYQGRLTRDAKNSNTFGSMGSGAAKGALIGAGIGTFFGPGIGTAIGAGIGGLVGGIAGLFAGNAKNKEAEELAKKQYEEQKRQTEINQEMLDIAKRGNAALAYRYAIDTSVMGGAGGLPAMGGESDAMGSDKQDVRKTGLLTSPWGCSRGYEWSTKYVNGKPTNEKSFHNGIDLTAPAGTPIGSLVSGEVIHVGSLEGDAGNNITIKGDNGMTYRYLHMLEPSKLEVGNKVSSGSLVGFVGSTGNSSGPHLHLAVKNGKDYVDPIGYLNSSLFSANGSYDSSSSSEADLYSTAGLDLQGTMRNAMRTHFVAAGGANDSNVKYQSVDIAPIVSALEIVNKTITDLGNKQDEQQRILDALTVRAIPDLGV